MPAPPTLQTGRLTLRPFEREDADRVQAIASSREVAESVGAFPHPLPPGFAAKWIDSLVELHAAQRAVVLAITATRASAVMGGVSLHIEAKDGRAELGFWLGREHWSRGFATESARAVIGYGFDVLGLARVYAVHFAQNEASARVLTKLGMKREGTLRQHVRHHGAFVDIAAWGVLADEWRARAGEASSRSRP